MGIGSVKKVPDAALRLLPAKTVGWFPTSGPTSQGRMLLGSKVDEDLVSLTQACKGAKSETLAFSTGTGLALKQCSVLPTITEHTMLASKAEAQTTGLSNLGRTGDQAHLNNEPILPRHRATMWPPFSGAQPSM